MESGDLNWTKLNVDAAFDNFHGGGAVLARDSSSTFQGSGTNNQAVLSPLEAEARAVLLATEMAVLLKM